MNKRCVRLVLWTLLLATVVLLSASCRQQPVALESRESDTVQATPSTAPDTAPIEEVPTVKYQVLALGQNSEHFKITGRHSVTEQGITWDWSAAGIEFRAVCRGDITLQFSSNGPLWFRVWINGVEQGIIYKGGEGENRIKIAEGLEEAEYTVKLARMNDIKSAQAVLEKLELTGYLSKRPADKKYYIEFVGDSLTCGTGIMDGWQTGTANAGGYVFMDATATFAYQLANKYFLNTDYSFVSVAGSHVATSDQYENYLEVYGYVSYKRDATVWKNDRCADLVVVNLGTNDAYQGLDREEFRFNLRSLIEEFIREAHGADTKLLFVLNMVTDNYISEIHTVLSECGGEANGLYAVSVPRNAEGGANHSNQAGHDAAAETIASYIRQKGLLES